MTLFNKTAIKSCVSMAVLTTALLLSSNASAQVSQQTGTADPARVERQLRDELRIPQATPDISIQEMAVLNAPAGSDDITFSFGGLEVEGMAVYSESDIAPLYKNIIGDTITLTDLYALANRITSKYRNDGYVLTQVVVPPQTIESGIARLRVVEGFIDNVTIQGDEEGNASLNTIREYAQQISNGSALNIADMERQLLLINDLPGMSARSVISPSTTTTGAADLTIILERDPYEGFVSLNNYGSRFLGPIQMGAVGRANSVLGFNETITAQTVLSPDAGAELLFGSLAYKQPVGRYGTTVELVGSITDTDPGFSLSEFGVEGLSRSIVLTAEHPFIRSRASNVFGRLSFDWRNVDSKNDIAPKVEDRIRALRAGVRGEFLDNIFSAAVNTVDFEVSQGIDILGASDDGDANLTRAQGDPTFTKANLSVSRLQRVANGINVFVNGNAQVSNDPLLSAEEFGLGGISTVRGFDPSEVVGDDAINGIVELQWNASPEAQLYTFLDSGTVWNKDATAGANKRNSLTSTGIGARLELPMDVDGEFVAALPLNRDRASRDSRDIQFFFGLNKKF